MVRIVALYGSPRRSGNTSTLLTHAVEGAREAGASVQCFYLRDLKISPCLELYGCTKSGRCIIEDDFQKVAEAVTDAHGIMLASPHLFLHRFGPYQDLHGPMPVPLGQTLLDRRRSFRVQGLPSKGVFHRSRSNPREKTLRRCAPYGPVFFRRRRGRPLG